MTFHAPPVTVTEQGAQRRVGVEFEFAGLDMQRTIEVVHGVFGGAVQRESRFAQRVAGTAYGDFDVVMDATLLKKRKYLEYLEWLGIDPGAPDDLDEAEELIEDLASTMVPYEVVTPPLPLSALPEVEKLREALRVAGAKGTEAGILYAFGLHLNPEAWSLSAATLRDVLRAFMLLREWIAEETGVVLTRKLTKFIDPFPDAYAALLLEPDYAPDLRGLIRDYLEHNPTRNRALDMLPVFALLEPELVNAYPVEKHQIKPRPAFHYRLPNCLVDDAAWRVAREWNHWVRIEELAMDALGLAELSRLYLERAGFPFSLLEDDWPETVRRWLAANR